MIYWYYNRQALLIWFIFRRNNRTLRQTSGEYCETFHQLLLASEKKSGLRTRTNLGTETHRKRIGRSSCVILLKNLGYTIIDLPIPPHVVEAAQKRKDWEKFFFIFLIFFLIICKIFVYFNEICYEKIHLIIICHHWTLKIGISWRSL